MQRSGPSAYPTGIHGNVLNAGTNELVIPNCKQTWGNIRKIADAPTSVAHLSFKSRNTGPERTALSRQQPLSPWTDGATLDREFGPE
jgi:hypothetical protein